jgi:hypothetical protein
MTIAAQREHQPLASRAGRGEASRLHAVLGAMLQQSVSDCQAA